MKKDADEFGRIFSADGLSYTDKDGCMFEWVSDKNAWFPKIDEDFIARYQMSYGVEDAAEKQKEQTTKDAKEEAEKKKEEQNAEAYKQWYAQYQQWYNSQIPKDKGADEASLKSAGEGSESSAFAAAAAADDDPMPDDPNSDEYREWYQRWMDKNAQAKEKKRKKREEKEIKDSKKEEEE